MPIVKVILVSPCSGIMGSCHLVKSANCGLISRQFLTDALMWAPSVFRVRLLKSHLEKQHPSLMMALAIATGPRVVF